MGGMVSLLATWPVEVMGGSGDIKEKTFGREAFNEERERGKNNDVAHKTQKNKGGILAFPPHETQPSLSLLTSNDDERGGVLEMMFARKELNEEREKGERSES